MDKLVQSLGITGLSKSQVSEMAKDLDDHIEQFRTRRFDGRFTFVAADALVLKVREGGRVVGVHTLVTTGINAEPSGTRRKPTARPCPSGSTITAPSGSS